MNIFANPDMPDSQVKLRQALCNRELARRGHPGDREREAPARSGSGALRAVPPAAAQRRDLKTPGLRDLSHSAPYMHNGAFATLADVLALYQASAIATRKGNLRNAAPELAGIALRSRDIEVLVAFLRSLNEDYN